MGDNLFQIDLRSLFQVQYNGGFCTLLGSFGKKGGIIVGVDGIFGRSIKDKPRRADALKLYEIVYS